MIQLMICRWMCPESPHVYRRMGVADHERIIKQASLTNIDLIQTTSTSKVMLDQGFADLVDEVAGPRSKACQRAYEEAVKAALDPYDREAAGHPAEACGRRAGNKAGKTTKRRMPAATAAASAATEAAAPERTKAPSRGQK